MERAPAGAWTGGKAAGVALPPVSFRPFDPRALGVPRVPDLVCIVARLFVDRICSTRVALQGGERDQRGRRTGQECDRPEPGIRSVRTVPGVGRRRCIRETTARG